MRCRGVVWALLVVGLVGCGSAKSDRQPAAADEPGTDEIVIIEEAPADAEMGQESDRGLSQKEIVQRDVRRIQTAMVEGDLATVIELTNPAALQDAGSDEELRRVLQEAFDLFAERGLKLDSLEFPEDPTFFSGEENDFVFVPILTIWTMKEDRFSSRGFQLGAKPRGGGHWTYLDGSNVNADNIDEYFSDFPEDQAFPETEMKMLDSPIEEKLEEAELDGRQRRS